MLAFNDLERLRKREGVIDNALLIISLLLVTGLQYFGLPIRWIVIFLVILWLTSFAMQTQFRNMYIKLFPSLKTLVEYEQQKYEAFPWWKKPSRTLDYIIVFLFIVVRIRSVEPAKNLLFFGIIVASVISFNFSRYILIRKIGG